MRKTFYGSDGDWTCNQIKVQVLTPNALPHELIKNDIPLTYLIKIIILYIFKKCNKSVSAKKYIIKKNGGVWQMR